MEDSSSVSFATSREDTFHSEPREDYLHIEPQPGTSELCERLERYVIRRKWNYCLNIFII